MYLTTGKDPTITIIGKVMGINKARHFLNPGQSVSWNQKEIRKKLKRDHLTAWLIQFGPRGPRRIKLGNIPINANLEILTAEIDDKIVGGRILLHFN